MTKRDIWDDRPVTFSVLSLDEGDAVILAFAETNRLKASRLLLAMSMRYVDTQELVFKSPAELGALPLTMASRVGRLISKALFVNGMRDDDPDEPDDPDEAEPPVGNGRAAEVTGPSH